MSFDALIPYVSLALGASEAEILQAFRPATTADLPGLLALRRAVTPRMWWDDEPYLRWRYFGRPMPNGDTPFWVLARGGATLAACGIEPVTLAIDGRTVDAVRLLDIMVRPDLDGLGLGAFMNLVLFRNFPITIVTGSNANSHRLLSRMFHHTADLVFCKTFLSSYDVIKARVRAGPFTGVLATGADMMLRLARTRRQVKSPRGVHIREIGRFDERVTGLSVQREQPGRIIVRRSADYLNWRFRDNPRCRHSVYGAFAGTTLLGYVVARFNLGRDNPRREGDIVDWLAAGDPADKLFTLPALFASAIGDLARRGARAVTCAAHDAGSEPAAEANGFRPRREQQIPFFVRAAAPEVHQRLALEPGWYLTRGDLDVD